MSRTDVHRPYRVQIEDPYNRHRMRLFHTWSTKEPEPLPLYNTCGCQLCTWQFGRKLKHRQERVIWRKVRQQLLKASTQDRDLVDVGSLRGSAY